MTANRDNPSQDARGNARGNGSPFSVIFLKRARDYCSFSLVGINYRLPPKLLSIHIGLRFRIMSVVTSWRGAGIAF